MLTDDTKLAHPATKPHTVGGVDLAMAGEIAVCALVEGDYHLGLGALVNSLYRAGYRGTVWAGHRGELPPWAAAGDRSGPMPRFEAAPGCTVRFVRLDFEGHLTNAKPGFILRLFDRLAPQAAAVVYFDADVVLLAPWRFVADWVAGGVAVCADIAHADMSQSHPLRTHWRRLAERLGRATRNVTGYYNGGFIGVRREYRDLVEVWDHMVRILPELGAPLTTFHSRDRTDPFMAMDQDMLNAAIMASGVPIAAAGAEAMDFVPGGAFMAHAVATPKPWRPGTLWRALQGYPPMRAHKRYWDFVDGPIRLFSPARARRAKLELSLAAAIGRFYRRA